MKTTLDIPEELLIEAMEIAGVRTKRDAVLCALQDFKRRARLRELTARLGKSKTFMSFDELMELREKEKPGKPKRGR